MNLYLLGPKNTFSDALANTLPLSHLDFVYCSSISAIFDSLMIDDGVALVPLENLLNGPVTSTLDGLTRLAHAGKQYTIFHTENLLIELYLGAPPGYAHTLLEAEEIYSHEQAIGQSELFLHREGFRASMIASDSTADAVTQCLNSNKKALAIASRTALEASGFTVHSKTTDVHVNNQTRFAVIAKDKTHIQDLMLKPKYSSATSICLDPKKDRQGLLLEIIDIISKQYGCNLLSIHSRPDQVGGFIFYLEIEGGVDQQNVSACLDALKQYCRKETSDSAVLHVFGSYSRSEFVQNSLTEMTIIGADGAMGTWLTDFFESKQVKILKINKDSDSSQKIRIRDSRYILFSVPVQLLDTVISEYIPYIHPDALVIDNSSIKVHTINLFEQLLPKNQPFVSIHTMFGPKEVGIKGKNVIIIESSLRDDHSFMHVADYRIKSEEKINVVERFFYKYGALVSKFSAEKHDQLVAVTQSIVHFISLSFIELLRRKDLDFSEISPFITPNTMRLLDNVSRTLDQSFELNQIMQKDNPFASLLRKELLDTLQYVDAEISANHMKELFESLLDFSNLSYVKR